MLPGNTTDADQPHVRGWLFWFADETGFFFQTLAPKDVFQQLKANPKTEVCFFNGGDLATARTLRVTGSVEFLDDPALKHRLLEQDMPFLAPLGKGADDPLHQVFRISHGQAFFWGMGDILKEHEWSGSRSDAGSPGQRRQVRSQAVGLSVPASPLTR